MNNYEEIFKKNREKNLFTKNEEINAEIIKNILDAMKIRKTKKENYINRTILSNISKNNSKKTKIDYTLTNPNALRIISDKIYKNKRRDKINDLSYEGSIYLPTIKLHFLKEKRNFLTCKLGIKIAVQGSLPSLNCQFT